MNDRRAPLASMPVIVWLPGETSGAFGERFVEAIRDKPPELVALVAWRMCERAWLDGHAEALNSAPGKGA